jgi:predicted alpha/beta-fold hydrolase
MREIAVKIGHPTPLTGIITQPKNFDASKPAVLILNSGLMHHIGTCRLSVKLARQVAEAGFLAIRFDFSGLGDSAPRRGTSSFKESSLTELNEVLNHLQETKGISKFISYGLCSGADASYELSKIDDRIIGIAQIDAYAYTNWKWFIRRYISNLNNINAWLGLFERLGNLFKTKSNSEKEFYETADEQREHPSRDSVAENLNNICQRGVHIYNIFTGDTIEINYENQYREVFSDVNFRNLLTLEYYEELEHIITSPEYQKLIPQKICEWVKIVSDKNLT